MGIRGSKHKLGLTEAVLKIMMAYSYSYGLYKSLAPLAGLLSRFCRNLQHLKESAREWSIFQTENGYSFEGMSRFFL